MHRDDICNSARTALESCQIFLASQIADRIETSICVTKIGKTAQGFVVETNAGIHQTQAVILAVQPHVAAAGVITAPPINVAFLGYNRQFLADPLDGHGVLSTKDPSRIISGVPFAPTMYAGRTHEGHVAILVYADGERNPELVRLSAADLIAQLAVSFASCSAYLVRRAMLELSHERHRK